VSWTVTKSKYEVHEPQDPVVYVVHPEPLLAVYKVAEPQPAQSTDEEVKQLLLQSGDDTVVGRTSSGQPVLVRVTVVVCVLLLQEPAKVTTVTGSDQPRPLASYLRQSVHARTHVPSLLANTSLA
jgi:hypothetical protein